jgi:hypothetical protein
MKLLERESLFQSHCGGWSVSFEGNPVMETSMRAPLHLTGPIKSAGDDVAQQRNTLQNYLVFGLAGPSLNASLLDCRSSNLLPESMQAALI